MSFISNQNHFDAIVVGARVAGASTAMLLARAGARVLLIDREAEIGDTLSTHALMRPAVGLLSRWGLLDRISRSAPVVTATQFTYGQDRVRIPFKPTADIMGLIAPRRWHLDCVLNDAAQEAGAEIRTGLHCQAVIRDPSGRACGVEVSDRLGRRQTISADLIIGADGRRSVVAQSVGAAVQHRSDVSMATVYSYVDGLANKGYRWYYSEEFAAGLIPTTNGGHCLFAGCATASFKSLFQKGSEAGLIDAIGSWEPEIAEHIARNGFAEKPRRFLGAPGHMRQCAGPGWALVGDAGYFKDPITAHGITDAFRDAQLLSDTILGQGMSDLGSFQSTRDALSLDLFRITERIASFEWDLDQLKHFTCG